MLRNSCLCVDRFRWVFCQLETLRQCLPASVRPILAELPETLDATYERILSDIPKSNRVHAHRLLQCLTVAVRPLDVEELAEVLAVDFSTTGGIPQLKEDLRWEDQEQAVLTACSSLIAVVKDKDSRVVQFSHFSVKEFLTSDRLATSKMDASRYHHIRFEEAHSIMAQACLGVLLRLDYSIDDESIRNFPLAEYAAECFGDHIEFDNALSPIRDGVDDLLNTSKPHFAAWLWMRDGRYTYGPLQQPKAVPLYRVVEFGYFSLVHYLIAKCPEDLNAKGDAGTLLHAASGEGHAKIVDLLLGYFVDVDIRNANNRTPLHLAAIRGSVEISRRLVERNADINARDNQGETPLYRVVSSRHGDEGLDVVRFLLAHGADADVRGKDDSTLLHAASSSGSARTAQLLLKHGANIHAQNKKGRTPLHEAVFSVTDISTFYFDVIRFLLVHGADVDAQDNDRSTPLHLAAGDGSVKAARLLLEHCASVHLQNKKGQTALQVALARGHEDFTQFLSEYSQSEK